MNQQYGTDLLGKMTAYGMSNHTQCHLNFCILLLLGLKQNESRYNTVDSQET